MIKIKPKARAEMETEEFNKRQKAANDKNEEKDIVDENNPMKKFLEESNKNAVIEKDKKKSKKYRNPEKYESSSERIYQIYQNPLHDGDDIHIDTHTNHQLHDSYDPYDRSETIYGERESLETKAEALDREFER